MNEDHGDFVIVHTPTPEQADAFMDNLVYTDEPLDPKDIPPPLAPGEEIMVPISVRVSTSTYLRIKALAEARGIKYTLMLREWVELELAEAEADAKRPLSRADRLHALEILRKLIAA